MRWRLQKRRESPPRVLVLAPNLCPFRQELVETWRPRGKAHCITPHLFAAQSLIHFIQERGAVTTCATFLEMRFHRRAARIALTHLFELRQLVIGVVHYFPFSVRLRNISAARRLQMLIS